MITNTAVARLSTAAAPGDTFGSLLTVTGLLGGCVRRGKTQGMLLVCLAAAIAVLASHLVCCCICLKAHPITTVTANAVVGSSVGSCVGSSAGQQQLHLFEIDLEVYFIPFCIIPFCICKEPRAAVGDVCTASGNTWQDRKLQEG